jgi:hypothetical protein
MSADVRGNYVAVGLGTGSFDSITKMRINAIKDQILVDWIAEKQREVLFLERSASAVDGLVRFEEVIRACKDQLFAQYDYLSGKSQYKVLVRDVNFQFVLGLSLASTVIGKINALVLHEEDKKLAASLKKMAVDKPATSAASQAPPNDMSELKKMVSDLSKKVELSSKKVSDSLYCLVLVAVGHLKLTPILFQCALLDCVKAGREEVWEATREEEGEEEDVRQKGQNPSQSGRRRKSGSQKIHLGRHLKGERVRLQQDSEGQRSEEGWQEVGAAFGLERDSKTGLGLYDFSELYGLSWCALFSNMSFLTHAFPPCVLLHPRLVRWVSMCVFIFDCTITIPKINIFDANTYPDTVTMIDNDIALSVLSRFAPEWLLGSMRFTNQLHSNLNVNIPKEIIGSLSAGAKYIRPISFKKSLVRDAWDDFHVRASRSWDRTLSQLYNVWGKPEFVLEHELPTEKIEEKYDIDTDPFYKVPIPYVMRHEPSTFREGESRDRDIEDILKHGQTELFTLLENMPSFNKGDSSVGVELTNTLKWCSDNNVLIKPTDKNLGTALVSIDWYNEKVTEFIKNNKGYKIIHPKLARKLLIEQVQRYQIVLG